MTPDLESLLDHGDNSNLAALEEKFSEWSIEQLMALSDRLCCGQGAGDMCNPGLIDSLAAMTLHRIVRRRIQLEELESPHDHRGTD